MQTGAGPVRLTLGGTATADSMPSHTMVGAGSWFPGQVTAGRVLPAERSGCGRCRFSGGGGRIGDLSGREVPCGYSGVARRTSPCGCPCGCSGPGGLSSAGQRRWHVPSARISASCGSVTLCSSEGVFRPPPWYSFVGCPCLGLSWAGPSNQCLSSGVALLPEKAATE